MTELLPRFERRLRPSLDVETILTGDVGPRVIRYGFSGGQNLCQLGASGEPNWQPRGGHRIWVAPEDPVKTFAPDNDPVIVDLLPNGVKATAPVQPLTGLEFAISVHAISHYPSRGVPPSRRRQNGCQLPGFLCPHVKYITSSYLGSQPSQYSESLLVKDEQTQRAWLKKAVDILPTR